MNLLKIAMCLVFSIFAFSSVCTRAQNPCEALVGNYTIDQSSCHPEDLGCWYLDGIRIRNPDHASMEVLQHDEGTPHWYWIGPTYREHHFESPTSYRHATLSAIPGGCEWYSEAQYDTLPGLDWIYIMRVEIYQDFSGESYPLGSYRYRWQQSEIRSGITYVIGKRTFTMVRNSTD